MRDHPARERHVRVLFHHALHHVHVHGLHAVHGSLLMLSHAGHLMPLHGHVTAGRHVGLALLWKGHRGRGHLGGRHRGGKDIGCEKRRGESSLDRVVHLELLFRKISFRVHEAEDRGGGSITVTSSRGCSDLR